MGRAGSVHRCSSTRCLRRREERPRFGRQHPARRPPRDRPAFRTPPTPRPDASSVCDSVAASGSPCAVSQPSFCFARLGVDGPVSGRHARSIRCTAATSFSGTTSAYRAVVFGLVCPSSACTSARSVPSQPSVPETPPVSSVAVPAVRSVPVLPVGVTERGPRQPQTTPDSRVEFRDVRAHATSITGLFIIDNRDGRWTSAQTAEGHRWVCLPATARGVRP